MIPYTRELTEKVDSLALVVKNEGSADFYFDDGVSRKKTLLSPGSIATVTEGEFASVPIPMRGVGGINPLFPDLTSSTSNLVLFDYETVGGATKPIYLGLAREGSDINANVWTIKFFEYVIGSDASVNVSEIQVLENVAWANRASLPWT